MTLKGAPGLQVFVITLAKHVLVSCCQKVLKVNWFDSVLCMICNTLDIAISEYRVRAGYLLVYNGEISCCQTSTRQMISGAPCNAYINSLRLSNAYIWVRKLIIIGSDNGLLPGRCQAIIWTSAEILLIRPLGTNFSQTLIGVQTFSFKKRELKMSSAKWHPFCLGLNELIQVHHNLSWI